MMLNNTKGESTMCFKKLDSGSRYADAVVTVNDRGIHFGKIAIMKFGLKKYASKMCELYEDSAKDCIGIKLGTKDGVKLRTHRSGKYTQLAISKVIPHKYNGKHVLMKKNGMLVFSTSLIDTVTK